MNGRDKEMQYAESLPEAKVIRSRWRLSIVWLVPLLAAIVSGVLVYDRVRERGPLVTIRFADASGLRAGQTPVKYRGVPVGEVTAIELSEDHRHALVKARLRRSAAAVASDGAMFWIVRPQVGLENITGLGTVLTGPEIQALPGNGEARSDFVGLERAPAAVEPGLNIVLRASQLGSLRPNAPVYYRGIEVGLVQDTRLSADAATVDVHVLIRKRYGRLVRTSSKFWTVGGADVSGSLFGGVEVKVESLRSLVVPGIAFATPDDPQAKPAPNGMGFLLYDRPHKEWLEWAPKIALPRE